MVSDVGIGAICLSISKLAQYQINTSVCIDAPLQLSSEGNFLVFHHGLSQTTCYNIK